jgi:hypothetical protein
VWRFEKAYPVGLVQFGGGDTPNAPEDWLTWFREEQQMVKGTSRAADYQSMVEEIHEPIVLVEDGTGVGFLWDGCHRTGAVCFAGRDTIPAIVGKKLF